MSEDRCPGRQSTAELKFNAGGYHLTVKGALIGAEPWEYINNQVLYTWGFSFLNVKKCCFPTVDKKGVKCIHQQPFITIMHESGKKLTVKQLKEDFLFI